MLLDTEGVGFGFLALGTRVIRGESLLLSQPNVGKRLKTLKSQVPKWLYPFHYSHINFSIIISSKETLRTS